MERGGGDGPRRCEQMPGALHAWTREPAGSREGWPSAVCGSAWADLQSPDREGLLPENRHAHGPHGSRLHWALSTAGRASRTSDGTVSCGFLISSTAESASFPRDGTRYWPTASHPRPRIAFKSWDVSDLCGGVPCLHGCASGSLSVEEGAALRLCVWASRGCGSSWGAWALGHVGFSGCWVWAQRSQWPGSRARIPSARPMGFVAL